MAEQPWMRVFVGDWIRDTRRLSLEARGLLADLRAFLWLEKERGVITSVITELEMMLGFRYSKISVLLGELKEKNLLKVEELGAEKIRITDVDMQKKVAKTASKSNAGKEGMKSRYSKKENSVIAEPISSVITETITKRGIGIDNGNSNEYDLQIGGAGEREQLPQNITAESILPIEDCLYVYMTHPICSRQREQVCMAKHFNPTKEGEMERLYAWGLAFNQVLIKKMTTTKTLHDWASHFMNWLGTQDLTTNPNNLFDGNRKNARTATGGRDIEGTITGKRIRIGGGFD